MSVKKFVIKKDSSNFTIFPNKVLQNLHCYEALGLYVYLASLPHGWNFHKDQMAKHGNIGRDKVNKLLKKLEVHGLIKMVQIRGSKGRFEHFELEVLDGTSFIINDLEEPVQPFTEKPFTANQLLVNSSYKENNKKEYIQEKEYISCSSDDEPHEYSLFDQFWSYYPRKQKKKDAENIWRRKNLEKKAILILDDIKQRIKNDWKGKEKEFIPLPTTYLNGERWNDEFIKSSSKEHPVTSVMRELKENLKSKEFNQLLN
jgi:predicted transcriptional regulator